MSRQVCVTKQTIGCMLQIYINEFSHETHHNKEIMNDFMGPSLYIHTKLSNKTRQGRPR